MDPHRAGEERAGYLKLYASVSSAISSNANAVADGAGTSAAATVASAAASAGARSSSGKSSAWGAAGAAAAASAPSCARMQRPPRDVARVKNMVTDGYPAGIWGGERTAARKNLGAWVGSAAARWAQRFSANAVVVPLGKIQSLFGAKETLKPASALVWRSGTRLSQCGQCSGAQQQQRDRLKQRPPGPHG